MKGRIVEDLVAHDTILILDVSLMITCPLLDKNFNLLVLTLMVRRALS